MAKYFTDMDEYLKASKALGTFSKTHNINRKDIELLIKLFSSLDLPAQECMKRNILIRFFSMVEGDIFHLNQIAPFPGYEDTKSFKVNFKKTMSHIYTLWKRIDSYKKYRDTKLVDLWMLRDLRNKIVHPKSPKYLEVDNIEISYIERVILDYREFLQVLTNDFFIEVDAEKFLQYLWENGLTDNT